MYRFMCSTLADKGESILLRSYCQPEDARPITKDAKRASEKGYVDEIPIKNAARATSAAPIYLPPENWGGMTFWDGGVLNNNPVDQLWNARYDLVRQGEHAPPVLCVLSLGCGWSDDKPSFLVKILNTLTRFMEKFMANTEAKHRDFQRLVQRVNAHDKQDEALEYFRLNPNVGKHKFDMANPSIMAELEEITREYIHRPKSNKNGGADDIEGCAQLIAKTKDEIAEEERHAV